MNSYISPYVKKLEKEFKMIKRLSIFLILPILLAALTACRAKQSEPVTLATEQSALLGATERYGKEYIDSLIFIGESTTYHMKSRGVLSGGKETSQVWATKSGTLNLDMSTKNVKIVYPDTHEELTFADAAARKEPKYVVLTFGLNGAVQKIAKGKEYYKSCYLSLINSLLSASPKTAIILQSAFPVAENMDTSKYTVDVNTLNEYIRTINSWTLELAQENGFRYLDTAECLKNENGFLKHEFQNGDGHHLTTEAYIKILDYISTHGYK